MEEHPELEFLGLDIADTPGDAARFVAKYGWGWTQIQDPDTELAGSLGLYGHPAVAVVDAEGNVVARHIGGGGPAVWEELAAEL